MRYFRSFQRVGLLLLLVGMASCGGSSSSGVSPKPEETASPTTDNESQAGSGENSPAAGNPQNDVSGGSDNYVPPAGLPDADGGAPFRVDDATYFLDEDEDLRARLIFRDASAESAGDRNSVKFFLTRAARNGRVLVNRETGEFSYVPNADFFGIDTFRYYVTSASSALDSASVASPSVASLGSLQATISLVVAGSNDAPMLESDIVRVIEQGTPYRVELKGSDVDQDVLTYRDENFPQWLSLNPVTGVMFGQPEQVDVGIHQSLFVHVADPDGESASLGPFAIEVIDVNDSPTLNPAQFPSTLDARERALVNLFPDDPDGEFVRLSSEPNDFLDVEIFGGSLTVTAKDVAEVTLINLVVIAQDLRGKSTREIIPITIHPLTADGRGRTLSGRRQGAGFHLVVLGDGYKADQQNTFNHDVHRLLSVMQSDPAIAAHLSGWNIHALSIDSRDSGIDDNVTEDIRQTAFDSGYLCRGIQRLICANDAVVFSVALQRYPYLDQIVLLVNDPRYGGSGGAIAVASSGAPEIAVHEMGHSVANLADEYVDSLIPSTSTIGFVEGRFANVSAFNDPLLVPWSHWIDDPTDFPTRAGAEGVGIFEGAFYQSESFYRPTSTSRMRDNSDVFGVVNGEQWALSVYQRTNPITGFAPLVRNLDLNSGVEQKFKVTPLFSEGVQLIEWSVDGERLAEKQNETEIALQFSSGSHSVGLAVTDITGRIRQAPPHAGVFTWEWQVEVQP